MTYKPIINYVLAAGIALGAALTPSSALAEDKPCQKLEQQLAACQTQARKKQTIEERCAEQRTTIEVSCTQDKDYAIFKAREELWSEATQTGDYEGRSRLLSLEEMSAKNGYDLCMLKAKLGEYECITSAKEKLVRQVQSKRDNEGDKVRTYQQCAKNCNDKSRSKSWIDQIKEEERRLGIKGRFNEEQMRDFRRGYHHKKNQKKDERENCLKKCGPNPNQEQEDKYRRIQGLGKIDL